MHTIDRPVKVCVELSAHCNTHNELYYPDWSIYKLTIARDITNALYARNNHDELDQAYTHVDRPQRHDPSEEWVRLTSPSKLIASIALCILKLLVATWVALLCSKRLAYKQVVILATNGWHPEMIVVRNEHKMSNECIQFIIFFRGLVVWVAAKSFEGWTTLWCCQRARSNIDTNGPI